METVKQRAVVGFLIAIVYIVVILAIPHEAAAPRGVDNDFTLMYFPSLMDFKDDLRIDQAYNTHGFTYYVALLVVSALIPDEADYPGWDVFTAARIISAVSGGLILFLLVWWIGIVPGVIAALLVAINPLFQDYAYHLGTDQFGIALVVVSAYLLSRGGKSYYIFSGLVFGLAVCVRYEFLVLVIAAAVYLGWQKRLLLFTAPVVVLLLLNFLIVDLPGGYDVLPFKYFGEGVVDRDGFDHSQYDSLFKILAASPLRMVRVYLRDLVQMFTDLCSGVILAPCIIGFLLGVWKKRTYALIGLALLVHMLYVNALLPPATRLLLPETVGITALGLVALRQHLLETSMTKRWVVLLLLFAPFLPGHAQQSFFTFTGNYAGSGGYMLELRDNIAPGSRIMSIHRQAAFITGGEWMMWPEEADDIYGYCIENEIDYVVWSVDYEAKYCPRWQGIFGDPEDAHPEFILVDRIDGIGAIYKVSSGSSSAAVPDL